MKFTGFEEADFDLFKIDGLEERMNVLINQLRPKFYALGEDLEKELSDIVGYPMKTHVAKHARRTTNPPNDSWFAMADAISRGYKMLPHFQVAVWETHVIIQWGLIYEAKAKETFGKNMIKHLPEIRKAIPEDYHVFKDHMKPEGKKMKELSDEELIKYADRLVNNKNGELMIGLVLTKEEAIKETPESLKELILKTWEKLNYLHKITL